MMVRQSGNGKVHPVVRFEHDGEARQHMGSMLRMRRGGESLRTCCMKPTYSSAAMLCSCAYSYSATARNRHRRQASRPRAIATTSAPHRWA